MSCDTCDHTLAGLGEINGRRYFRCDRCGTLVILSAPWSHDEEEHREVLVPKLVERCREFQEELGPPDGGAGILRVAWHRLGIEESIHPPEQRSKT